MSDLVSLYYLIQKATIHAVVSEEEEWHLNVVVVGANRAERVGMVGLSTKCLSSGCCSVVRWIFAAACRIARRRSYECTYPSCSP